MQIHVEVNSEATERSLGRLAAPLSGGQRRELMAVLGKGLEQDLQRHFLRRNQEPNKRGWPKQHFWGRIRRATSHTSATEDTATVTISDPAMRAKVHGAVITPKGGRKALAIPANPKAAGIQPGSGLIPDLFVARSRVKGRAFLARREGQALRIYYWLVRRVTVPKDPQALPRTEDMSAGAIRRADSFIARRLRANT